MRTAFKTVAGFLLLPFLLAGQTVSVPEHQFGIDESAKTLLCRAQLTRLNANASGAFLRVAADGTDFNFISLVDYFLFINLIAAEDNDRKNIYYARYDDDEPFLFIPWDLDGTLGNRWNGQNLNFPPDTIFSNRLYERIIHLNVMGFNDEVCRRYAELEATGFYNAEDVNDRIRREYNYLKDNGVYQREERRWPESVNASADHLNYTFDWNEARTSFLSAWTCDMTVPIIAPAAAPTFSLFPNPSRGRLQLSPSPTHPTEWGLLDLTGRQLQQGQLATGENSLDLGASPPGMYLLKLGLRVYKIVVF